MHTTVILLTGGAGKRMKSIPYPKQFRNILGEPLFLHSLKIYEALPQVNDIILVANGQYRNRYESILKKVFFKKLKRIVDGGSTRLKSVTKGVEAIAKTDLVIVHEGSNPCTSTRLIKACIAQAKKTGACTAYIPARDTVVLVKKKKLIASVLPRKQIAYTCAPQVYSFKVVKAALAYAKKHKVPESPLVALARKAGSQVSLALSESDNIKVTTDADVYTAEQLLKEKKQCLR